MDFKKFRVNDWFSIIGTFASLIGLIYIFYPIKDDTIKLDLIVSSCDNLTVFNSISEPEIKAQFEYKGKKISKLWRVNIILKNVSEKTIVGSGQLKNILSDNLIFLVKDEYQIIDKKLINSDFSHDLSVLSNDTIQLYFGQWRTNEIIEYSFYITTDKALKSPDIDIFYQPKDRQIIDGDINFLRSFQNKEKELITSKLGKPAKKVIYVFFLLITLISLIIFVVIAISNPISYIKRKIWRNKYLSDFNKHVTQKTLSSHYINKPENYTNWGDFNGTKYPKTWGIDFEIIKPLSLISTTLFFIILSFSQVIIIIDLIQLFP